jgi:hypothetical protein
MDKTFTREYLKSLPEMNKNARIKELLNEFHGHIIYNASNGAEFAMFDLPESRINMGTKYIMKTYNITVDNLIKAFQMKYPDSVVTYVERDGEPAGIRISWS